jgi:hypothetical protein
MRLTSSSTRCCCNPTPRALKPHAAPKQRLDAVPQPLPDQPRIFAASNEQGEAAWRRAWRGQSVTRVLQVPLDGFGSFSTVRPRRASGGTGDRRLLLPDTKAGGGPASLLQDGHGLNRVRGSPPEDKLLSPPMFSSPLIPAPANPPKRRGRPPGSSKTSQATATAAQKQNAAAVAAATSAASSSSAAPPPKRRRQSDKEEASKLFPTPITAPSLPLSRVAAARRPNRDTMVFFGESDDDQRWVRAVQCFARELSCASIIHPTTLSFLSLLHPVLQPVLF